MTSQRPFYLGQAFLQFHAPAAPAHAIGLVICPPFGWQALASHRALRSWGAMLAARGHPVVRLDPPGTGDAGGSPRDGDQLEVWRAAVSEAARWLRLHQGCVRVATLGIGFGGFAAVLAAAEGSVDDVILWGTPAKGRTLVRELKAFARLNADESRAIDSTGVEGGMEVGGFVLNEPTLAALGSLDLTTVAVPGSSDDARHALLLGRDGLAPDVALEDHLRECGMAVAVVAGDGFATMTSTPQATTTPEAVIATSVDWLSSLSVVSLRDRPERVAATPNATDALELWVGDVKIRERPVIVDHPSGHLYGVLSEPLYPTDKDLRAVLLNAGAIRRSGPGRLWTEVARDWAAQGVTTLRLDMEAIGDSDGDRDYTRDASLYVADMDDNARVAVDAIDRAAGHDPNARHLAVGLCSGAYWAFHGSLNDPRISTALLLNPRALYFRENLDVQRDARKMTQLTRGLYWKKMLRGEVGKDRVWSVARLLVRSPMTLTSTRRELRRERHNLESAFDSLEEARKRTVLVFGEDEPLDEELALSGVLDEPGRWPGLAIHHLPGRDHTLRPLATQRRVHDLLDEVLAGELTRGAARQEVDHRAM